MHLSHLFEDLEAWYLNFDLRERVDTTFRPGLDVPRGDADGRRRARTTCTTRPRSRRDYDATGGSATARSIQTASRLQQDVAGPDGTLYPKGTAIPQRADFNTLDNPFFWSAHPERDGCSDEPAAGPALRRLQPVERRLPAQPAGDGRRPARRDDAAVRAARPRQGFNAVLQTTHRQNFLVPPRRTARSRSPSYARRSGIVRQVGPPSPLSESSSPW